MQEDTAYRRAHMPTGTDRVLGARTLAVDHRRLSELLAPGYAVLDVGCGTGAITAGILERVLPGGRVVGVDINPRLIEEARARFGNDRAFSFTSGTSITWSTIRSFRSSPAPGSCSGFRIPRQRWNR